MPFELTVILGWSQSRLCRDGLGSEIVLANHLLGSCDRPRMAINAQADIPSRCQSRLGLGVLLLSGMLCLTAVGTARPAGVRAAVGRAQRLSSCVTRNRPGGADPIGKIPTS